jgi:hypothetical protein
MWKTYEGSTGRLLQLCLGYFVFYVITGYTVKYFRGSESAGLPGMAGFEFLAYSTLGGVLIATGVVIALRWWRLQSPHPPVRIGRLSFPREWLYIVPSGICTAVIVPATTLLYSIEGVSVMVAMVIMRGCVIVISRIVDTVQIAQGILRKKVYWQENVAVVFAIAAVVMMVWGPPDPGKKSLSESTLAMAVLWSYVIAYAIRIYIMNFYKNTRGKGVKQDNRPFFGIEQLSVFVTLVLVAIILYHSPGLFGWEAQQISDFREAIDRPHDQWVGATFAGMAFGVVAFFSVFIFLFKGRTATFVGLVNRLTSLVAGTVSTLLFAWIIDPSRFPGPKSWYALGSIRLAVWFLSLAERRRTAELLASRELEPGAAKGT